MKGRPARGEKVLLLITGYFNFRLDDGGTVSLLTILRRLRGEGFRAGLTCLTDRCFARRHLSPATRRTNLRIVSESDNLIVCRLRGFPFPLRFHICNVEMTGAYRGNDPEAPGSLAGLWRRILDAENPDVTLTTEDDVFSMSACAERPILRLHRISTDRIFKSEGPAHPELLRKLAPRFRFVCGDGFLAQKLLVEYGLTSIPLPPLVDLERYRMKSPVSMNSGHITLVNGAWHKGLLIFLTLAKMLPRKRFLVRGRKNIIEPHVKENGLSNVLIEEQAEGMRSVYRRTRILLVPSLWEESFARVIIEAMANGIPVIANDVGGIKTALHGGGFLATVNVKMKGRPDFYTNPHYHFALVEQYLNLIAFLDDHKNYAEASKCALAAAERYKIESDARFEEFQKWLKLVCP